MRFLLLISESNHIITINHRWLIRLHRPASGTFRRSFIKHISVLLLALVLLLGTAASAFADQKLADKVRKYSFSAGGCPCDTNPYTLRLEEDDDGLYACFYEGTRLAGFSWLSGDFELAKEKANSFVAKSTSNDIKYVFTIADNAITKIECITSEDFFSLFNGVYGKDNPPLTGDSTNPMLLLALCAASAVACTVIGKKRKAW